MNKVDQLVKTLLFAYPTLYRDRTEALMTIFMSGNYEWDKNGCLQPTYALDGEVMNFSDLDEDDAELADEISKNTFDILSGLLDMRRIQLVADRQMRELISQNIDTYASEQISGSTISYERLSSTWISGMTAIASAPFGKIDSEWAEAMEEFLSTMAVSFNRIFSLHYDDPLQGEKAPEPSMFSRMPESSQTLRTKLLEIADKVEEQTGHKARQKAIFDSITK